jgi:DNA-binding beta-propeller fold protein YncE
MQPLLPAARVGNMTRVKWASGSLAVAVVAVVSCTANSAPPPPTASEQSYPSTAAPSHPVSRSLVQPAALAAGPDRVLFIADDSRHMIFARHSDGRITVVAGTGVRGYSGDGGPATAAQLNDPSGVVYDQKTATLYVADTGNNRVRAIGRSGRIHTVAGTGHTGWVGTTATANTANLTAPTAVTLSPRGQLYIACDLETLRLDAGRLTRTAGTRRSAGISGVGGPARDASTDSANGLAFDAAGNLYLTGSATKGLLLITATGHLHLLCGSCFYPRGNAGVVTAPNGSVLAMNTRKIYRFESPTQRSVLINFATHKQIDDLRAIVPTGLAVELDGTIYIDTNENGGFTNATTLIALAPGAAHPTVVWRR